MRIAVTSDTHGNYNAAYKLFLGSGPYDALLHAGDFYQDASPLADLMGVSEWRAAAGNCDCALGAGPLEVKIEWLGFRLLLLHGHRYHAHFTDRLVIRRAEQLKADIVVYGHSHISEIKRLKELLVVNPGSPAVPRKGVPSVAVLELIKDRPARAEIILSE